MPLLRKVFGVLVVVDVGILEGLLDAWLVLTGVNRLLLPTKEDCVVLR